MHRGGVGGKDDDDDDDAADDGGGCARDGDDKGEDDAPGNVCAMATRKPLLAGHTEHLGGEFPVTTMLLLLLRLPLALPFLLSLTRNREHTSHRNDEEVGP
jgi:hypothetical protein